MQRVKQMALPLMPQEGLRGCYVDQAAVNDTGVFAAYTPYGIAKIDHDFSCRIRNIGTGRMHKDRNGKEWRNETPQVLRDEILDNEHLHPCIIENLLQNLDTYEAKCES